MLAALAVTSPATAQDAAPFVRDCACSPVADAALARLRGGFNDGQGLVASIGLERLMVVNGAVVSTVNLSISDLSKVTPQQALQLQTALATTGLMNGAGTLNALVAGATAGTTVIQNSLNNQAIRNTTVIDVSTNSQQFIKAANLQTTLQDALNLRLTGH